MGCGDIISVATALGIANLKNLETNVVSVIMIVPSAVLLHSFVFAGVDGTIILATSKCVVLACSGSLVLLCHGSKHAVAYY